MRTSENCTAEICRSQGPGVLRFHEKNALEMLDYYFFNLLSCWSIILGTHGFGIFSWFFFWVSTKWFKILGIFWVTKHGSHQYCWCGADSDKNYFLQHLNGISSFKHLSWKILELLNKNCPVNLHPLFSFWKHGLVCNPEKIRSKIWTWKNSRVQKTGPLLFKKRTGQAGSSLFE